MNQAANGGWVFTMNAPGAMYEDYFDSLTAVTKSLPPPSLQGTMREAKRQQQINKR
jgi:hypothetical protein